ncbi:hypothetical protein LOD99_7748 [Oopsacas minuta]|uniref:Uncharacterized protein n=1 Tax=Oopsacas minuta TaxID=111878 RepID=A0AAV7JPC9_9METZ|nr:hypothetical protein LOD99_7748 [Oopsacas minuta]
MLERIVKIKKPVQKALLDLEIGININDDELTHILIIVKTLDPLKLAVEVLCRRDANFISAEATIKFLLEEIQIILLPFTKLEFLKQLKNGLFSKAIVMLQS